MQNSNPYYVLLDANIWITERLLQTTIGNAFLYAIAGAKSSMILPEVVELEIAQTLPEMAERAVEIIKRELTLLRQLSGHELMITAPSALAIKDGIAVRWDQLSGALIRQPFTHDQAKSALHRVLQGLPPSGNNNEQFRDCCIWDAALSMAEDRTVHLISQDTAFYENRNKASGIAKILQSELIATKKDIQIHYSLRDFLANVSSDSAAIDEEAIGHQIINTILDRASEIAAEGIMRGSDAIFKLGSMRRIKISGYTTPKPSLVAISFEVSFELERTIIEDGSDEVIDSTITLKGVGSYDPTTKELLEADVREWSKHIRSPSRGTMGTSSPDKEARDRQYGRGRMRIITGDGSAVRDLK